MLVADFLEQNYDTVSRNHSNFTSFYHYLLSLHFLSWALIPIWLGGRWGTLPAVLRDYSKWVWDYMGYRGSNSGQALAKQMSCLLYYLSSPHILPSVIQSENQLYVIIHQIFLLSRSKVTWEHYGQLQATGSLKYSFYLHLFSLEL